MPNTEKYIAMYKPKIDIELQKCNRATMYDVWVLSMRSIKSKTSSYALVCSTTGVFQFILCSP